MATYKVIQDVEAEDKLLGPLTLRQFIYAVVAVVSSYLSYFFLTHNAGFMIVLVLPIALVMGFLAFPWGRDQPTEVWALAKVRFILKPRRRIWDQNGAKELVTITAPKKVHMDYTNGLSQTEVRSRLQALADTIDSRGWAIKNANISLYGQMSALDNSGSDRLVAPTSLPQPVEANDIQAADDILDEKNNASAQRLDSMITKSAQAHRERVVESMQQGAGAQPHANNYWFLNQPATPAAIPSNMVTFNTQVVAPGAADNGIPTAPASAPADEQALAAELDARKKAAPGASFYGHLHQIQPLSAQPAPPATTSTQNAPLTPATTPVAPAVTPKAQAAILSLASNDDLDVATIAREAERTTSGNEVVVKLH